MSRRDDVSSRRKTEEGGRLAQNAFSEEENSGRRTVEITKKGGEEIGGVWPDNGGKEEDGGKESKDLRKRTGSKDTGREKDAITETTGKKIIQEKQKEEFPAVKSSDEKNCGRKIDVDVEAVISFPPIFQKILHSAAETHLSNLFETKKIEDVIDKNKEEEKQKQEEQQMQGKKQKQKEKEKKLKEKESHKICYKNLMQKDTEEEDEEAEKEMWRFVPCGHCHHKCDCMRTYLRRRKPKGKSRYVSRTYEGEKNYDNEEISTRIEEEGKDEEVVSSLFEEGNETENANEHKTDDEYDRQVDERYLDTYRGDNTDYRKEEKNEKRVGVRMGMGPEGRLEARSEGMRHMDDQHEKYSKHAKYKIPNNQLVERELYDIQQLLHSRAEILRKQEEEIEEKEKELIVKTAQAKDLLLSFAQRLVNEAHQKLTVAGSTMEKRLNNLIITSENAVKKLAMRRKEWKELINKCQESNERIDVLNQKIKAEQRRVKYVQDKLRTTEEDNRRLNSLLEALRPSSSASFLPSSTASTLSIKRPTAKSSLSKIPALASPPSSSVSISSSTSASLSYPSPSSFSSASSVSALTGAQPFPFSSPSAVPSHFSSAAHLIAATPTFGTSPSQSASSSFSPLELSKTQPSPSSSPRFGYPLLDSLSNAPMSPSGSSQSILVSSSSSMYDSVALPVPSFPPPPLFEGQTSTCLSPSAATSAKYLAPPNISLHVSLPRRSSRSKAHETIHRKYTDEEEEKDKEEERKGTDTRREEEEKAQEKKKKDQIKKTRSTEFDFEVLLSSSSSEEEEEKNKKSIYVRREDELESRRRKISKEKGSRKKTTSPMFSRYVEEKEKENETKKLNGSSLQPKRRLKEYPFSSSSQIFSSASLSARYPASSSEGEAREEKKSKIFSPLSPSPRLSKQVFRTSSSHGGGVGTISSPSSDDWFADEFSIRGGKVEHLDKLKDVALRLAGKSKK